MTTQEMHYQILTKHFDFTGKHVLEIGCGQGALTRHMGEVSGARFINAIEYDLDYWGMQPSSGPGWEIAQGDVRALRFDDDTFDYVLSIGVFEHINGLDQALREIQRVLKPGGLCYAWFEPVYTSIIGHHYRFWIPEDLPLIPPWGHLWMEPSEMHEYIRGKRDVETANQAVEWIYESPIINRYTRKDYYGFLASSGMTNVYMREMFRANRYEKPENEFYSLPEAHQARLLSKYAKDDLVVHGFEIILQKTWQERQSWDYFCVEGNRWTQEQAILKSNGHASPGSGKWAQPIRFLGRIFKK